MKKTVSQEMDLVAAAFPGGQFKVSPAFIGEAPCLGVVESWTAFRQPDGGEPVAYYYSLEAKAPEDGGELLWFSFYA